MRGKKSKSERGKEDRTRGMLKRVKENSSKQAVFISNLQYIVLSNGRVLVRVAAATAAVPVPLLSNMKSNTGHWRARGERARAQSGRQRRPLSLPNT